jgi:hypothetical protein
MRHRSVLYPLALVPTVLCASSVASALGSHEGTFKYAIDAPWRIEPVMDARGHATYGAIPITLTIDDENAIPMDAPGRKLGNFCEMVVAGPGGNRHITLRDLAEIEMTGNGTTTYLNGAWQPGTSPPPHQTCEPSASNGCEGMRSLHGTSEWHATAWYEPYGTKMTAGQDVRLDVDVRVTRDPSIACTGVTAANVITLRNHLLVHPGEAPLPRFDDRWVYGDLHWVQILRGGVNSCDCLGLGEFTARS